MKKYEYRALSQEGQPMEDVVLASSMAEAMYKLLASGLCPVEIRELNKSEEALYDRITNMKNAIKVSNLAVPETSKRPSLKIIVFIIMLIVWITIIIAALSASS